MKVRIVQVLQKLMCISYLSVIHGQRCWELLRLTDPDVIASLRVDQPLTHGRQAAGRTWHMMRPAVLLAITLPLFIRHCAIVVLA